MAKIAIVIATYNGEATLNATLNSLAAQGAMPDQIVVMDGQSSDHTVEILRAREAMLSHWRSERDTGLYDAWNKALPLVESDWVSFIGCDDVLADEATIAAWKAFLVELPDEVGIAYGRVAMLGGNGEINSYYGEPWTGESPAKFRQRMLIPFTGAMIRRSLFDSVGMFDTSFKITGDYDWSFRALKQTRVMFFDRTVALMGDGGLSGASGSQVKAIRELWRIFEANGERKPLLWRWTYAKARTKEIVLRRFGPGLQRRMVDLYRICTGRSARGSAR